MNANVPRSLSLAAVGILAGCTASVGFQLDEASEDGSAQLISRGPASQPDFSTQPKPDRHDEPTTQTRKSGSNLVGLYGELQSDWPTGGERFDGSSNVAQITFATEGACSDPDVDRAGERMVFASTQHSTTSDVYLKSTQGRTLTQLTTDPADDIMPVFHPSGNRIAFASNRAGNWDIYVMSVDGGQPMKVTDERDPELHPSWSPDGRRLIYSKLGSKSGRWEMWVVDTKNPGVRRFLDYGLFPQWCPDVARSKILFQRARQRGSRFFSVWTIDFVNDDAVHPTEIVSAGNAAVINPAWSADGSRVVFVTVVEPEDTSDDDDDEAVMQSDIWIVNLDGSGRTNLTNGRYANYQPVWSGDGRVFFVSNRTGTDNVWAVTTSRAMDSLQAHPARITTITPGYNTPQRVGQP
ncbi:MAG: TolB family protein [Planctomycetota bacterium]